VGLTGHSGEDSVGTTELELGIVELGNVLICDLGIVLLGEVTDSSSWRESHEWLCDLSEDLLLVQSVADRLTRVNKLTLRSFQSGLSVPPWNLTTASMGNPSWARSTT